MEIGAFRVHRLLDTLRSSSERKCDDGPDRFSNKYSVILLSIFATVMSFHQFVGKKIVCWAPAHFTKSQVLYSNSYCWTQDTYYLPWESEVRGDTKERLYIAYYQWMPFILILQVYHIWYTHALKLTYDTPCTLRHTLQVYTGYRFKHWSVY